jgi:hypothetical protein
VDYIEFAVGVGIILMAVYLRYVEGLRNGWELLMFWVYWIVGLLLIRDARNRRKNESR